MTLYVPKVHYAHLLVAASNMTLTPIASTTYPFRRSYDRAKDLLFKFGSASSAPKIEVDLGATQAQSYDRVIIPIGHNLIAGDTITIIYANNGSFTSSVTAKSYTVITADVGAQINLSFTSASPGSSSDRYWRITFTLQSSRILELSELWITKDLILDNDNGESLLTMPAKSSYEPNIIISETHAGYSRRLQLGTPRRRRSYGLAYLNSTDKTLLNTFEAAINRGQLYFYFTDHEGVTFVAELMTPFEFSLDNPGYSKVNEFSVREVL